MPGGTSGKSLVQLTIPHRHSDQLLSFLFFFYLCVINPGQEEEGDLPPVPFPSKATSLDPGSQAPRNPPSQN